MGRFSYPIVLQRAFICLCAQAERGTAEMGPGELQLIRDMYLSPVFKASGSMDLDLGAQGMYLSPVFKARGNMDLYLGAQGMYNLSPVFKASGVDLARYAFIGVHHPPVSPPPVFMASDTDLASGAYLDNAS